MAPVEHGWRELILASYQRLVGRALLPHGGPATGLDRVPFVVLCHDTSADPVFVYANLAAQALWERPQALFLGWPSRLTAPESERPARAAALAGHEVVRGYTGVRVTASGRLFRICDATVWPVCDNTGVRRGQAAAFSRWEFVTCASPPST